MELIYFGIFLVVTFFALTQQKVGSIKMQSIFIGVMSALAGGGIFTYLQNDSLVLFPLLILVELFIISIFQQIFPQSISE